MFNTAIKINQFLLHNAMLAWYMLSSCVCLSVRPSVICLHSTNTAKRRNTQTTPYDSLGTLQNSNSVTLYWGAK